MLSQKYRFHSRGGVRHTYQKGKNVRTPTLSLIFAPNSRNHRRFAVVVSKKVLKSAVGRNRIRRRVYEAIRLEMGDYPEPIDYIFVINNKFVIDMPFFNLRREIVTLFDRSLSMAQH